MSRNNHHLQLCPQSASDDLPGSARARATACDVEEFHPSVWADGDVADLGLTNSKKFSGDLKYNWLVTTDRWKELIALRNGLKQAGPQFFFALSDPVRHYLTHTGRRLASPIKERDPDVIEGPQPSGSRMGRLPEA